MKLSTLKWILVSFFLIAIVVAIGCSGSKANTNDSDDEWNKTFGE